MMWLWRCNWGWLFGSRPGWGWMIGGGVMMVLFWGGLLLLAAFALRAWQHTPARHGAGSALAILQARYARGEIDKAQYDEIKRDIEG